MRIGCGALMLATLLRLIPHARRYFLSERWGGYGEPGWRVDLVQNPVVMPVVLVAWMVACGALIAEWHTVVAAAVNVACCYYFFILMRWRGVLRGMGAPGFIAFWLAVAVLLIEFTRRHAPALEGLAVLTLQVDFALMMLSAGAYKYVAGYRRMNGMELGMVNPQWGYLGQLWGAMPPQHWWFRFCNEMAWATEAGAALLMLVPATRFAGGTIMLLSFVFIATQIRLGFLCEMVMVMCLVFFHAGSAGATLLSAALPAAAAPIVVPASGSATLLLATGLWGYLLLLPLARIGLSYNLHQKRALPGRLQPALEWYTNIFGLIVWRVFSADHTNFMIRIYEAKDDGSPRHLISRWTDWARLFARFNQVAEAITVTTLFTTLKYYPTNRSLFVDRLLRYSRTVPVQRESRLIFEHVSVVKRADRFELVPAAEFVVDVGAGTVEEITIDPTRPVRAPIAGSPIHESVRPGSYAPLKS